MTKGKTRNKKPAMHGNKTDENWGGAMRSITPKDNINDNYYPKSVQYISNADQRGKTHPTQKPVALMEYLIKTYTNSGDTVLDFTMGSGTTGVACANLNRKFIGIEREPEYFQIAKARILDAYIRGLSC